MSSRSVALAAVLLMSCMKPNDEAERKLATFTGDDSASNALSLVLVQRQRMLFAAVLDSGSAGIQEHLDPDFVWNPAFRSGTPVVGQIAGEADYFDFLRGFKPRELVAMPADYDVLVLGDSTVKVFAALPGDKSGIVTQWEARDTTWKAAYAYATLLNLAEWRNRILRARLRHPSR